MLTQLIEEMDKRQGAVSLRYLSGRMQVDESVLAGMIDLLVHKGIVKDHSAMLSGGESCSAGHCMGCSGHTSCPVMNMPKMYSLKKKPANN